MPATPKLRSHRAPDPSPLTVSQRSAISQREQRLQVAARLKTEYAEVSHTRPVPSMPRVQWLERRDIDDKAPPIAPEIVADEFCEEGRGIDAPVAKPRRRRNMAKTGKYIHQVRVSLTDEQRDLIERAVKLSGKSFTEWARENLLELAETAVKEQRNHELEAAE
jgi:hypothetical protein